MIGRCTSVEQQMNWKGLFCVLISLAIIALCPGYSQGMQSRAGRRLSGSAYLTAGCGVVFNLILSKDAGFFLFFLSYGTGIMPMRATCCCSCVRQRISYSGVTDRLHCCCAAAVPPPPWQPQPATVVVLCCFSAFTGEGGGEEEEEEAAEEGGLLQRRIHVEKRTRGAWGGAEGGRREAREGGWGRRRRGEERGEGQ